MPVWLVGTPTKRMLCWKEMVVFGGDSSTDQSLNLWPPPDLPALGGES